MFMLKDYSMLHAGMSLSIYECTYMYICVHTQVYKVHTYVLTQIVEKNIHLD